MGPTKYDKNNIFLKEAYLMKYKDGKLVDKEKLVESERNQEPGMPIREHSTGFHTKPSEEKFEYSSLIVKVIYSNGATFEKEIYSN